MSADVAGKTWHFTLAAKGTSAPGATPVGTAPEFLLRVLDVSGPRGASTGQLTQKTQHGVSAVDPGSSMPGHDGNTVMEVSGRGNDNLNAFGFFVVDAGTQFSFQSS